MKYFIFAFLAVLFFAGSISAQLKSATGTFISNEGGNHYGIVCLKIKSKKLCLIWGDKDLSRAIKFTKFKGFEKGDPFTKGAVWRITYGYDGETPVLASATFTGRILK